QRIKSALNLNMSITRGSIQPPVQTCGLDVPIARRKSDITFDAADSDVAIAGVYVHKADVVVGFDATVARTDIEVGFNRNPEFNTKRAAAEYRIPMGVGHARFEIEAVSDLTLDNTHFVVVDSPADGFDTSFNLFPFPRGYAHRAVVGFNVDGWLAGYTISLM